MILALVACTVPAPDLARPTVEDPRSDQVASPPPARGPEEEKLYQVLYAGELGEHAAARGSRTRLLAWLVALELDPAQLRALDALAVDLRAADEAVRAARDEVDARELAALTPIYDALDARLAQAKPLTEEEGARFAAQLEAARTGAHPDGDPRAAHYARVRGLLEKVRPWIATLSDAQRARLGQSRFVLARRIGPFVNPGDYADLVGTMWDGGDFGSLRATVRPSDERQLDLGGLWSVEALQAGPNRAVEGLQAEALVMMAGLEPELPSAIAARLAGLGEPALATEAPEDR